MTNERLMEKAQEYEKLMNKAQSLIGSWIYDKTYKDEYLYAYDIYDEGCEYDVKLCCIAIDSENDTVPYIKETEADARQMLRAKKYHCKVAVVPMVKDEKGQEIHSTKIIEDEIKRERAQGRGNDGGTM